MLKPISTNLLSNLSAIKPAGIAPPKIPNTKNKATSCGFSYDFWSIKCSNCDNIGSIEWS